MELSTAFFILTPFGFFCTEHGIGYIVGPLFLISGILCRLYEANGVFTDIVDELLDKIKIFDKFRRPKLSSEEFWKTHFKGRMFDKSYPNHVSNSTPESAKEWADYICECHGATPPSSARYEEICKEMGIESKSIKDEKARKTDRIQFGKYYLMKQLVEKYKRIYFNSNTKDNDWKKNLHMYEHFKHTTEFIVFSDWSYIPSKSIECLGETWIKLTKDEKEESQKWVKKYEEKIIKEYEDYIKNGIPYSSIRSYYGAPGFQPEVFHNGYERDILN